MYTIRNLRNPSPSSRCQTVERCVWCGVVAARVTPLLKPLLLKEIGISTITISPFPDINTYTSIYTYTIFFKFSFDPF